MAMFNYQRVKSIFSRSGDIPRIRFLNCSPGSGIAKHVGATTINTGNAQAVKLGRCEVPGDALGWIATLQNGS